MRRKLKIAFLANRFLSRVYYSFLRPGPLASEVDAVSAGIRRFASDHASDATRYYQLRRNIHRLEKALIMRPRRSTFAEAYIGDTVQLFNRAMVSGSTEQRRSPELVWARDVLDLYFSVANLGSPVVAAAFEKYQETAGLRERPSNASATPYCRDLQNELSVSFEDFLALCWRRRSVRWYTEQRVPRDLLENAIEAAALSPSACNRQPFYFRVFDEPDMAGSIARIARGTAGFWQQIPCTVVVVGQLRAYSNEADRHAIYVDGALAAMAFMFALETLKLASCPINWQDVEPQESEMRRALSLEPDERVIMLIAVGWPDPSGLVPYSAKRTKQELSVYG